MLDHVANGKFPKVIAGLQNGDVFTVGSPDSGLSRSKQDHAGGAYRGGKVGDTGVVSDKHAAPGDRGGKKRQRPCIGNSNTM